EPRHSRRDEVKRLAASLLVLLAAGPSAAGAASFSLEAQQRTDALRVGAQSITQDAFDTEWRVTNQAGDTLTVITPFHRLVFAARNAAFKNQPLKEREPEKLLREQQDRLVGWGQPRGARPDFARRFAPAFVPGRPQ